MKYVKVGGLTQNDNEKPTEYLAPYKDLDAGVVVEGIYKNKHEREGEYGPSITHYIELEDKVIGMNGTTILNDRLSQVPAGTQVRITYLGLGEKSKGKRPPFLFEVERAASLADSKILDD